MFLSASFRLLVNVESLNSVESVGNVSRHRSVPVVVPYDSGYTIRYVPAISGESIAHGYQSLLVDIALREGLPVGVYSRRKEFLKFSEDTYLKDEGVEPPKDHDDITRFEVDVLLKDIVADVGGFLYAGDIPVKRTSRFQVGYMLPALEDVTNAAALEAQFHVRFLLSRPSESSSQEGARLGQIPYNIEAASALYTFTFNLDIDGIGVPVNTFGKADQKKEEELAKQRVARRKAALKALGLFVSQIAFGARHSRYLPNAELMSCTFALSDIPFTVSAGNFRNYIERTFTRAEKLSRLLGIKTRVWAAVREEKVQVPDGVKVVSSPEEIVEELIGSIDR
jgi:CRISPR-associated regulatory protein, Csa2 family